MSSARCQRTSRSSSPSPPAHDRFRTHFPRGGQARRHDVEDNVISGCQAPPPRAPRFRMRFPLLRGPVDIPNSEFRIISFYTAPVMPANTMTVTADDSGQPLILASSSPRRRQLLELIGLPFQVVPPSTDEQPRTGEEPISFAQRAAREKALEVANRQHGQLVLGADTVVEIDRTILGKPGSPDVAEEMLRSLSGREHLVHTAITLINDGRSHDIIDTARVRCVSFTEQVISWYVSTGEPLDKAGAYAVQGIGGLLVEKVEGSPYTVVGLPIHRLPELFAAHNLEFWSRLNA